MHLSLRRERRACANSLKTIKSKSGLVARYFQRTASLAVLSIILPVSLSPLSVQGFSNSNDEGSAGFVVLDTNQPQVLVTEQNVPEIKPGKSVVNLEKEAQEKQAREKQEELKRQQEAAAAKARSVVSRERSWTRTTSSFDEIYAKAEAAYGVDARLLRAVHYVETGQSDSTMRRNASGATGPMQFLPSTWRRNGVDGNGDGTADITNVEDAVFSAAYYLKACGYPNVRQALWSYNPSSSYYNRVMDVAHSLGM